MTNRQREITDAAAEGASGGGMAMIKPPVADKRPVTDIHHGIVRSDDYAWLRADNWREVMRDPSVLGADIRAYLEAENASADAALAVV
jgi:oligopeptidase B